ncbi:hypothetical protein H0H92_014387 [Tricholoma furcatifolium]|nr:hypothetical protein H0H92_014387 [Tricholoma furcatifolium]
MAPNPFQFLTFSLLLVPSLLIATYFLAAFPHPPEPVYVHKSLASLPIDAKSWSIYPETFFSGGAYVSLPYGRVRYWVLGPEAGQKVVLIHGLSIPSIIWRDVAPELASRGYRVLVYDLYGRGYSDAPQTTYNTQLYTVQLALLMQHLRWERAIVAGLSMGGGIAMAFTAQFPHLVDDKVVLIASAGLMEATDFSRTAKFMSSPLIQTVTASVPVQKYLQSLISKNTTSSISAEAKSAEDPVTEIVRVQSAQLAGYNAAISSSLRDGPVRGQAWTFASEGFADRGVSVADPPATHCRDERQNGERALRGHDTRAPHARDARAVAPRYARGRRARFDG